MEWWWLPSLGLGLVVGFFVGANGGAMAAKDALRQLLRTQAVDRYAFLRVLRREIANHLVQRDPLAFERLYERLHDEVARYSTFSQDGLRAEFRALCERYPQYSDFDFIGTREHVLYPDAFDWGDEENITEHFRNIVRFQALNSMLDESWRGFGATSEDDLRHLREYIPRVLDARLRRNLEAAMRIYYQSRGDERDHFETDDFSVVRVPHFADVRYGIHFKKTGEYGLFALFEDHRAFYGSDATFEQERWLNGVKDTYAEAASAIAYN